MKLTTEQARDILEWIKYSDFEELPNMFVVPVYGEYALCHKEPILIQWHSRNAKGVFYKSDILFPIKVMPVEE